MITIRIPWDTYLFYLTDHNWDPISIIDTFLCLKCIVFDLCSHISVQGKWLVLNCPLIGGSTNIGCQILGGGGGGAASGFDVTDPLWSQLEYQLSTAQWPHYGFNGYTG